MSAILCLKALFLGGSRLTKELAFPVCLRQGYALTSGKDILEITQSVHLPITLPQRQSYASNFPSVEKEAN